MVAWERARGPAVARAASRRVRKNFEKRILRASAGEELEKQGSRNVNGNPSGNGRDYLFERTFQIALSYASTIWSELKPRQHRQNTKPSIGQKERSPSCWRFNSLSGGYRSIVRTDRRRRSVNYHSGCWSNT